MNRKSRRFSPLRRTLQLLRYLMEHRFGAETADLADEVGVGRRAVYRYLNVLNAVGVRVINVNAGAPAIRARWRLVDRNDVTRLVGIHMIYPSRPVAGTI